MLNSTRLSATVIETLRNFSYEQKIKIYDENCLSCPYKRLSLSGRDKHKDMIYPDLNDCVKDAESLNRNIKRECAFDENNVRSLTEIVSNTCDFWNGRIIKEEETENSFTIGSIDGLHRVAKEIADFRERLFAEIIPQQGTSAEILT